MSKRKAPAETVSSVVHVVGAMLDGQFCFQTVSGTEELADKELRKLRSEYLMRASFYSGDTQKEEQEIYLKTANALMVLPAHLTFRASDLAAAGAA